jgi:hypothetical protein
MVVDITAKKPETRETMDRRKRLSASNEDDATKPRKDATPVAAIMGPK